MKSVFGLALLALATSGVYAQNIEIVSPKHAYTFAYGDAISHQIERDHLTNEMVARVTFSNYPYAGDREARRDEMLISFFLICNSMPHEMNFSRALAITRGFQSRHYIRIFHMQVISSSRPRKFFS